MSEQTKKGRISICLLLAALVGTAVAIYLFQYMGNTLDKAAGSNSAEAAGTAIGIALVTPSIILGAVATIFAWVGWATRKRGFALVAGILYAVRHWMRFYVCVYTFPYRTDDPEFYRIWDNEKQVKKTDFSKTDENRDV